jgi:hypothetical protein
MRFGTKNIEKINEEIMTIVDKKKVIFYHQKEVEIRRR